MTMETRQKPNILIGVYFLILLFLLLCVVLTPLLIQGSIPISRSLILEEDTFESVLIVMLFAVSFFVFRSLLRKLASYRLAAEQAGEEKSKLISRLTEAFSYIGTVNVEIAEIGSVLCNVDCYPRNKRQFRAALDQLSTKAMTVAAVSWLMVRMIDRHSGQTVSQHTVKRHDAKIPSVTIGNRAVMDGSGIEGLRTIVAHPDHPDLLTAFILPKADLTKERSLLLGAVLHQIEMVFMLFRAGCLASSASADTFEKEAFNVPHN